MFVSAEGGWHDGTTHLLFEPLELLEKLAALTRWPRINLLLYHGVLAPHAARRERVVAYGSPEGEPAEPSSDTRDEPAAATKDRRYWAWADLMRRAFEIDVLACPRCGGRMQLISTLDDPAVLPNPAPFTCLSCVPTRSA